MKRFVITIIAILITLIISMPVIYADSCECDVNIVRCRHDKPQHSTETMGNCHPITSENAKKCNCPQKVPCDLTKAKPSVLLSIRAIPLDLTAIKVQWVKSSEQNDLDLSSQMEISDFCWFSERSSPFYKIYLTNQAFLC